MSAAAGDEERLLEQAGWLSLLLRHLSGPRVRVHTEIDDLVQEVFLRILASPAALPEAAPGERPLRRYLARVARNCVFDVLRALRARKRSAGEVRLTRADWSSPGLRESRVRFTGPGPITRALIGESQEALLRAFDELPDDQRRVIGLRQLEGLSAAETARRMRRSESAVHSLYRRALAAWGARSGLTRDS